MQLSRTLPRKPSAMSVARDYDNLIGTGSLGRSESAQWFCDPDDLITPRAIDRSMPTGEKSRYRTIKEPLECAICALVHLVSQTHFINYLSGYIFHCQLHNFRFQLFYLPTICQVTFSFECRNIFIKINCTSKNNEKLPRLRGMIKKHETLIYFRATIARLFIKNRKKSSALAKIKRL